MGDSPPIADPLVFPRRPSGSMLFLPTPPAAAGGRARTGRRPSVPQDPASAGSRRAKSLSGPGIDTRRRGSAVLPPGMASPPIARRLSATHARRASSARRQSQGGATTLTLPVPPPAPQVNSTPDSQSERFADCDFENLVWSRNLLRQMGDTEMEQDTLQRRESGSFRTRTVSIRSGNRLSLTARTLSTNDFGLGVDEAINAVRDRRASIHIINSDVRRRQYELNESYRQRVRASVAEKGGVTRLLKDDAERRVALWGGIVKFIASLDAVDNILKRRKALAVLRMMFVPMLARRRRKLARAAQQRELMEKRVPTMKPPSLETIKALRCFADWPVAVLKGLLEKCYPVTYARGEFVCFEGDVGDRMYLIAEGHVDIYVRTGANRSKSRRAGIRVATLGPPPCAQSYFGEYAVICREPRFASVCAASDYVDLWAIDYEAVSIEVQRLPASIKAGLAGFARRRREENLSKMYPLKVHPLAQSSVMFSTLAEETLHELLPHFKPVVVRTPCVVYKEGQPADTVYFIANGRVKLVREGCPEATHTLLPNTAFGDAELLWLSERRGYTAVAEIACDLWILHKDDLHQYLLTYPGHFLAAKAAVANARGGAAVPCGQPFWMSDTMLTRYIPAKTLRQLTGVMVPRIVGRGDALAQHGEVYDGVVCIAAGRAVEVERKGSGNALASDKQRAYAAGSVIGVPELLTFQTRWAKAVVAQERCEVWVIPRHEFLKELKASEGACVSEKLLENDTQDALRARYNLAYQAPSVYDFRQKRVPPAHTHPHRRLSNGARRASLNNAPHAPTGRRGSGNDAASPSSRSTQYLQAYVFSPTGDTDSSFGGDSDSEQRQCESPPELTKTVAARRVSYRRPHETTPEGLNLDLPTLAEAIQ